MILCNKTIDAEELSDFCKNLDEKGLHVSKKISENLLRNLGRALDFTAVASAVASRNRKTALSSLPKVNNFYHRGEGYYGGKFV